MFLMRQDEKRVRISRDSGSDARGALFRPTSVSGCGNWLQTSPDYATHLSQASGHVAVPCSISQFDQDRLVVGGIDLAIDLDAADPVGQIFRRENEVATIRAISPLR